MERSLWYLLLTGDWGQEKRALVDFYADGNHLGAALHRVLASAPVLGLSECHLLEAAVLENGIPDPGLTTRLAEGVYVRKGLHAFTFSPSTAPFLYPLGVAPLMKEGVLELGSEKNCLEKRMDDDCFTLRMRLQQGTFSKLLYGVLQNFPGVSSMHITVRGGSGSGYKKEKWVNSPLDTAEILRFLKHGSSPVLENGFIDFSVRALGKALRLDVNEQKRVCITARKEEDFHFFLQLARTFGVVEVDQVPSVELCHYRLHESTSRKKLTDFLIDFGFRKEPSGFFFPIMRYLLFDRF